MDYKNWYAISVQSNKEQTCAAQMLSRKSILMDTFLEEVTFLTRKEIEYKKDGRRQVKSKKLMPGYVLVKVRPDFIEDETGVRKKVFPPTTFDLITRTTGVQSFVNCDKKNPIPMRPSEVKKMFDLCDEAHLEVKQNIQSDFSIGDILEVVAGPFKGYNIEVMNIWGDKLLGNIDMFGRTVPAEFTKTQVYKNETNRS